MANYKTYSEFLNQAYRKILAACLEDEAIDTLRILQNKDYLLLRINELFSQIYLAERERKIEQQASLISSLLKQQNGAKLGSKPTTCNNCQLAQQTIESLALQKKELQRRVNDLSSNEDRSTKRIESLLLKENEEMKREIKKLQTQLLSISEEYETQKQILSRQNHRLKLKIKEEIEKSELSSVQLKSTITRNQEEKEKLQRTVFEFLEKQSRQQKDIREVNAKLSNANSLKERHQTQISQIRNQNNILQQKVSRLEEQNSFIKEKNSSLDKEIKTLKKQVEQLESELINPNISSKQKMENKGQNEWSIELLGKLNQSQKRNIELQKHINLLKHQLTVKQKQFNEATLHQEKIIIKTNEQMKKLQQKYDKELRNSKQEYKRLIVTNSEEIQQAKIQQKIDIIKRYDNIVSEKERLLMKRQEQILALNRTLAETQRNLTEFTTSHEEQRQLLQNQLKNERQNLKELKKHYASELCEQKQAQREFKDKQRELIQQKEQLKKLITSKDKQIKEYKRQMIQINEKIVTSELKYQEYKDKNENISKTIDGYISQINGLKDQLKQKEKRLKQSLRKNAQFNEERDEMESKSLTISKNQKRLEQKIKRLEAQLIQKRETLLGIHQNNKQEVIDVYQRTQQVTAQTRKQLENYYMNLLRSNEQRKIHEEVDQLQRNQNEQVKQLKYIAQEYEEKCNKYKHKYYEQIKLKETYQQKINVVCEQLQVLKKENAKAIDLVREEKKRNLSMMKAYQDKMLQYYNHFNEFKREFYLNIREEFQKLRNELKSIAQYMQYQSQRFKQFVGQMTKKTTQQIELINTNCQLRIDKIRHQYQYGIVLKLEQEKRQIQLISEMKVKQQGMEFYTILAEKQHQINTLMEKEGKLIKKIDEFEAKYESTIKINQQANRKLQELKEIIAKMNQKVTQAERGSTNSSSEADYYRRQNIQLKKQINMLETTFKQKIEKCKERYTAENEKIFVRYNNELSKFVGSNKKSMDFLLQGDIANSHIPTKGARECEKYDQIKKQIEEQKKKLKMLEQDCQSKGKADKTTKIFCERDVARVERMRRS